MNLFQKFTGFAILKLIAFPVALPQQTICDQFPEVPALFIIAINAKIFSVAYSDLNVHYGFTSPYQMLCQKHSSSTPLKTSFSKVD